MKIGEKIKEARLEKKMTQEQLAIALKIRPNKISAWERGYYEPSANMIRQIAIALGCDANFLFGFGD